MMVNFKTINKENNMAKKEKFAKRIVPGKTALINGHKIPDPKLHQIISFVKSGIRIIGYIFLPFNYMMVNFKTTNKENSMKQPDPKLHQQVSFIKSAVRIVGYILLPFSITTAMLALVLSEVIGIFEELV